MRPQLHLHLRRLAILSLLVCLGAAAAPAQTTAFTYQGRLTDAGSAANGPYDLQFALFDSAAGGTQIGTTQTVSAVQVASGNFTVQLDFGVNAFPGADRFLEIGVRRAGGGAITTLSPRQQISSTPYAIRTLNAATADTATNATQLGGVAANQYVQTNDSRLSDSRSPTAGSSNYIQSNPNNTQSGASFNISGNGTLGGNLSVGGTLSLNIVNANTQYNLGGSPILSVPGTLNTFAGLGAGQANSTGQRNVFFGSEAGLSNTSGTANTFFGSRAGRNTTSKGGNSFFGETAGFFNTGGANSYFGASAGAGGFGPSASGSSDSFFGYLSGQFNVSGTDNSFFGAKAGQFNTASGNSFFGSGAGTNNDSGSFNAFFGSQAGSANATGQNNSFFGSNTGQSNTTQRDNTFIGVFAGNSNGTNDTTNNASLNTFVGSTAGFNNTTGRGNSFFGESAGFLNTIGSGNTVIGVNAGVGGSNLTNATAIGANALVSRSNSLVLGNNANVGIGTTTPLSRLEVHDTNIQACGPALIAWGGDVPRGCAVALAVTTDDAAGSNLIVAVNNSGGVFVVTGNGNVGMGSSSPDATLTVNGTADKPGGGSWAVFSDERLKNLKGRFTPGLKAVLQLKPLRYEYKPDNALGIKSSGEHIGFSAQAVEKIIPEAVSKNDKGYLLVNNDPIMWTMLNAIKEQQKQIERQQKQIATLLTSNAALNARLRSVENSLKKKAGLARRQR